MCDTVVGYPISHTDELSETTKIFHRSPVLVELYCRSLLCSDPLVNQSTFSGSRCLQLPVTHSQDLKDYPVLCVGIPSTSERKLVHRRTHLKNRNLRGLTNEDKRVLRCDTANFCIDPIPSVILSIPIPTVTLLTYRGKISVP